MASKTTWQWMLPGGEVVVATLDVPSGVESVFHRGQLLSRSPPGGSRDGHALSLTSGPARIDFDVGSRQCAMSRNGELVPPSRVATGGSATGLIVLAVAFVVIGFGGVLATLAIYGARKFIANAKAASDTDAGMTASYRSPNGLLVAHYPPDFAASTSSENVVQLMRGGARDDSILLISVSVPISSDPAELGRVAVKPIVDSFPAKGGSYKELTHGPADCLGNPGYMTSGVATLALETANTWSCTFVSQGHGYVVFMSVNQAYSSDEPLMHRIIDATELLDPSDASARAPAEIEPPAAASAKRSGHPPR